MKRKILPLLFRFWGIFILFAGLYLIIGGVKDYITLYQQEDWPMQTAHVSDISSRIKRSGVRKRRTSHTVYDIQYEYEVEGMIYSGELIGSYEIFMVGDPLTIKYDPDDPSFSTTNLSPQLSELLVPLIVGLIFTTIGIFLSGLYSLIRKWRRRSLPEEPELLPPEAYQESEKPAPKPPKGLWFSILRWVLPVLMAAGILYSIFQFTSGPQSVTFDEFSTILADHGYTAIDSTESLREDWRIGSMLVQSSSLEGDSFRIDFCLMDTTGSARSLFAGMSLPAPSGEEISYTSTQFEFYSLETAELYTAKIRVGDTVVYAGALTDSKEVLVSILSAIGYMYV